MFTPEFHSILHDVEALKEHQAIVIYLEKNSVLSVITLLHKAIRMEEYVPPKIKSIFKSRIEILKISDRMKGMIEDHYNILLPIDKIDALYKQKLQNSKVFVKFIAKLQSTEMQKLIDNLYRH